MHAFQVQQILDTHPKSAFSFDRERPFSFRQDEKKMGVQPFPAAAMPQIPHGNAGRTVPLPKISRPFCISALSFSPEDAV